MSLWDAEYLFKLLHLLSTKHDVLRPLLPLFRAPFAEPFGQELARAANEPNAHVAAASLRRWLDHLSQLHHIPPVSESMWQLWRRHLVPVGSLRSREGSFVSEPSPMPAERLLDFERAEAPHPLLSSPDVGVAVPHPQKASGALLRGPLSLNDSAPASAADVLFAKRSRDVEARPPSPRPLSFSAPSSSPIRPKEPREKQLPESREPLEPEAPSRLSVEERLPFLPEFRMAFCLLASITPIGFWLSRTSIQRFADERLPELFSGPSFNVEGLRAALQDQEPIPSDIINAFIDELRRYAFSFALEFVQGD